MARLLDGQCLARTI